MKLSSKIWHFIRCTILNLPMWVELHSEDVRQGTARLSYCQCKYCNKQDYKVYKNKKEKQL